ncbi:MAG: hypothetical protein HC838_03540 [Spirulinaceae cyanobacterium RM2_2_10]|nr:hypothetical protein [Spirulinaceae cyanobacterium RM2_2_10]
MPVLHLDLKPKQDDWVELRCHRDNPNDYDSRNLPLAQIADLLERAETDYYTRLPVDYVQTGRRLFDWLDGEAGWLRQACQSVRGEGLILALAVTGGLAHLPWEVLHDGQSFLVERQPGIVPVRWAASPG